jgi:PPOX class probable F420-dependent enzyme
MTSLWNKDDPAHAKALRMLEHDLIAWFVTLAPDGSPRSVPVWYFWDEDRMLVVSEPETLKVAAVRRGAPVLMHLDSGGPYGDDVVILRGHAEVSPLSTAEWLAHNREAYIAKYSEAIDDYGMALDDIAAKFSTLIVFTPERVQAW